LLPIPSEKFGWRDKESAGFGKNRADEGRASVAG
jgi:hypothetical protein